MEFTYDAYRSLLRRLTESGYAFKNYNNWEEETKTVILRHDVDNSLSKAVSMSEMEKEMCGGAIYFVLLSTNFYNIASLASRRKIQKIIDNGGLIGLHFDETQYDISSAQDLLACIEKEAGLLTSIIGYPIEFVSMHRPSRSLLSADLKIPGIKNSYGRVFFEQMKYISDSRRKWREDVEGIVKEGSFKRLHILTHPMWYGEYEDRDMRQALERAIWEAPLEYYDNLNENIRDLDQIISRAEIERGIIS